MVTTHRLKRRGLSTAAVLAVSSLILAGCGRDEEETTTAAQAVDLEAEISGTVDFWGFAPDIEGVEELIEPFLDENPDVEVNFRSIPETEYASTLTAAITAGDVPDIVIMQSQQLPSLLSTGAFAEVPTDILDPDLFFEASWETGLVDGTAYAVPWYAYVNAVYYREDILAEEGLEAPGTWDELRDVSQALVDAGYETPFTMDTVFYDTYTAQNFGDFTRAAGGSLLNEDMTEWTLDTPEALEALEFINSLIVDGYMAEDEPVFLDRVPYMINGDIVLMTNGPWVPEWFDDAEGEGWIDDHLAVTGYPEGPEEIATSFAGGSIGVLQDGDNTEAAWHLASYMSQPEVQLEWYDMFNNLPAVEEAWSEEPIASDPWLEPLQETMPYSEPAPAVSGWPEAAEVITEEIESMAYGQIEPEEALANMQSRVEQIPTGVE